MLSPGSRIGGYFNYGVGASAYGGGSNLASPGLFGSGNQIALGVDQRCGLHQRLAACEQTTSWTVGGGFEYFWTRNFSSTIYGNYTEISYNSTVVNSRWFCGGSGASRSARANGGDAAIPASSTGRWARTTTGSRCRVCGSRWT